MRARAAVLALLLLNACYYPTVVRNRGYHPSDADVSVTRIVHGSVVVDFRETKILVDPWYSPAPPLGQDEPIGLGLEALPPLRGILLTHEHDDHFDEPMLRDYPNKRVRVVVPRGLGERVQRLGYLDVVEVEPWDQTQIGGVIVMAVASAHGVPACGYVLESNGTVIYVAGDTRYDEEQFRAIAKVFPKIDAALLPIGGIRILGRRLDMTPEEAARAVGVLRVPTVIPYHYGMTGPFPFFTSAAEPVAAFAAALEAAQPGGRDSIRVLEPGESWHHYR